MKGWRINEMANVGAWSGVLLGVGVIGGLMLSIALVGIPRVEHPAIVGPYSLEYLDLMAQRGMSDAAWAMVFVSGVSALVGGLGVYLVARTLQEAKRSADAAERAVATAIAASSQAFQIGRDQVRAHVSVVGAILSKSLDDGEEVYTLRFDYQNSGQTPAREVWTSVMFRLKPLNTGHSPADEVVGMQRSRSDLPRDAIQAARFWLGPVAAGRLRAAAQSASYIVIMDCAVTFTDVIDPAVKHEVVSRYYANFHGNISLGDHTLLRTNREWDVPMAGGV